MLFKKEEEPCRKTWIRAPNICPVIEVDSTTEFGFDPSQITESKSLDRKILVEVW